MPDSRAGNGRNSLRRTPALQRRSRCCRRGAVGERIAVAAGGAALRIVPGEICTRNSGAGLCGAHGADRAGGGRSYVIHARGSFAESAGAPALRSRRRPNLQAKTNRNCQTRYETRIGLERAGSVKVKTLKKLHALQGYKLGCCNDVTFVTNHADGGLFLTQTVLS